MTDKEKIELLTAALAVVMLDPAISTHIKREDPRAYLQGRKALWETHESATCQGCAHGICQVPNF